MKFHIVYQGKNEKPFSWVLKSAQGVPLAQSSKDYSARSSCRTAIKNLIDGIAFAEIASVERDRPGWSNT